VTSGAPDFWTRATVDKVLKLLELSAIRGVIHRPMGLILNSSFEEDFTGWYVSHPDLITIDEEVTWYEKKSCKFHASKTLKYIRQFFPIPIGTDWLTNLMCFMYSKHVGTNLTVIYYHTDGTTHSDSLDTVAPEVWERQTLTPQAGKYIEILHVQHNIEYDVYLDNWITVF